MFFFLFLLFHNADSYILGNKSFCFFWWHYCIHSKQNSSVQNMCHTAFGFLALHVVE